MASCLRAAGSETGCGSWTDDRMSAATPPKTLQPHMLPTSCARVDVQRLSLSLSLSLSLALAHTCFGADGLQSHSCTLGVILQRNALHTWAAVQQTYVAVAGAGGQHATKGI
eukprot:355749-Chlamydomonas_euryale.AAC.4